MHMLLHDKSLVLVIDEAQVIGTTYPDILETISQLTKFFLEYQEYFWLMSYVKIIIHFSFLYFHDFINLSVTL